MLYSTEPDAAATGRSLRPARQRPAREGERQNAEQRPGAAAAATDRDALSQRCLNATYGIANYERLEDGGPAQCTWAQIIYCSGDGASCTEQQQAQGFSEGLVPVGDERAEEGPLGGGQFGALGGGLRERQPDERSEIAIVDKRVRRGGQA